MDLKNLLAQLREERAALDAAISHLESVEPEPHCGPGRPLHLITNSPTNGANNGHTPPPPTLGEE